MEYTYKGFKIRYEVHTELREHHARGKVISYKNRAVSAFTKEFHTECKKYEDAQEKIKELMEKYIDFEYQQFISMRQEKH